MTYIQTHPNTLSMFCRPHLMVSLPAASCCLMLLLNVQHPRVEDPSLVWHRLTCNNVQNHQSRLQVLGRHNNVDT